MVIKAIPMLCEKNCHMEIQTNCPNTIKEHLLKLEDFLREGTSKLRTEDVQWLTMGRRGLLDKEWKNP